VVKAVRIMRDKDTTTSILVTKKGSIEPVGIVTERDTLYHVLAQDKYSFNIPLKNIMNYPLISADEESSIKDGICLMRNKYIRRLPIEKMRKVTGIVTSKRIVGNIPSQGIDFAEAELPKGRAENDIICPLSTKV
jgi:CBS domain-containing protein